MKMPVESLQVASLNFSECTLMDGALLVVMNSTFFSLNPLCVSISFMAWYMSSPLVCVERDYVLTEVFPLCMVKSDIHQKLSIVSNISWFIWCALNCSIKLWLCILCLNFSSSRGRKEEIVNFFLQVHVFPFHLDVFHTWHQFIPWPFPHMYKGFLCCPKIRCILSKHSCPCCCAVRDWE